MKKLLLISVVFSGLICAMEKAHVWHVVKKEKEVAPERSPLDDLPADIRLQILPYVVNAPNINEAIKGLKKFYVASPESRKSVAINKAIITYLIQKFALGKKQLQQVVINLNEFPAFKNSEMHQWIEQEKKRLAAEKELRKAANDGDVEKVKELINQHVNINAPAYNTHKTALIEAAIGNKTNAALMLIDNGADVNARFITGLSALDFAIRKANLDLVKALLEKKADPNVKLKPGSGGSMGWMVAGRTPLLISAFQLSRNAGFTVYRNIIEALLKAGADPKIKEDGSGKSVEDYIKDLEITDEQKHELLGLIEKYSQKK